MSGLNFPSPWTNFPSPDLTFLVRGLGKFSPDPNPGDEPTPPVLLLLPFHPFPAFTLLPLYGFYNFTALRFYCIDPFTAFTPLLLLRTYFSETVNQRGAAAQGCRSPVYSPLRGGGLARGIGT